MENKRMAVNGEQKRSPRSQKIPLADSNVQDMATLLSPRFKSAAAMAGWDEEALLLATLIVEDTPVRDSKHKKRSLLNSSSPSTNSSSSGFRIRRSWRTSQQPIPVILDLDAEETPKKESGRKKKVERASVNNEGRKGGGDGNESKEKNPGAPSSSSALPFIDKLRDELSCAICLEICFEPSTTPCGHSFCRKCLRSAADKCGKKCPKCRQLISNGRSCTVNTVLWNTIQLLFPQEIEAREAAGSLKSRQQAQNLSPETAFYANLRNTSRNNSRKSVAVTSTTQEDEDAALARRLQREIDEQSPGTTRMRTRRGVSTSQHQDAALALRLQREEFIETFRGSNQERLPSPSFARANLRAMASRAMNPRTRDRRR